MDGWQSVAGQLAQIGLPSLGTLIGNMVLPGVGGLVGQSAGKLAASAVAAALGVPATPEAVSQAIQADPDAARVKLAEIDAESKAHAAELADIANARAQTVSLAQAGSNIAWGAPVISVVIATGFFSVMILLFFVRVEMPQSVYSLLNILFGVLTASFTQVANYWLGSSESSRRNGDAIRAVAQQAVTPSPAQLAQQAVTAAASNR